ncbi:MAG: TadE family protein [Pseudomonadota bacterium]
MAVTRDQNRRRGRRKLFGRDRRGSTAVEFALVAPIFLTFMFSIFEVGWFFFANSIVDATVTSTGRVIRTGQIQKATGSDQDKLDTLYDDICDVVEVFGDCDTRLTLEVATFTSFANLAADTTAATCANAPPEDLAAIPFETGGELEIVRVRVCFLYKTVNPAIGIKIAEAGTSYRRIVSTMIFRNEPYESN